VNESSELLNIDRRERDEEEEGGTLVSLSFLFSPNAEDSRAARRSRQEIRDAEDTTAADVVAYVKENAPKSVNLIFIDRDDSLTPTQLQEIIGSPIARDAVQDAIADRLSDAYYESANEQIKELVGEDGLELLTNDPNRLDELQELMMERDESTPFEDLTRRTGAQLFRYRLSDDWADFPMKQETWRMNEGQMNEEIERLATITGLSATDYHDTFKELIENAQGGSPEIIWYGEPSFILKQLRSTGDGTWAEEGTLTFKNPNLLIIDNMNGSGHDVRLDGASLTVPFKPSRIVVDAASGNGYGWDTIASVVKRYYATDVSFEPPQRELAAASPGISL
jgi:hypothetical protein